MELTKDLESSFEVPKILFKVQFRIFRDTWALDMYGIVQR